MLLALAALWGASFMFIKIGDRELQPITLVAFRMGLGAFTLAPIVLFTVGARRTVGELRAAARPLVVTGLLNSAIPILAISWAETRIDSGLTAIIQASAPLFAALLALRFSPGERVGGLRLVGLVVGFAGVALLVGGRPRERSWPPWRSSSPRSATRLPVSMRESGCAGFLRSSRPSEP